MVYSNDAYADEKTIEMKVTRRAVCGPNSNEFTICPVERPTDSFCELYPDQWLWKLDYRAM